MKLSQVDIDNKARKLADGLLANAGLKNAKKIAAQIKRYLLAETKRRKNL